MTLVKDPPGDLEIFSHRCQDHAPGGYPGAINGFLHQIFNINDPAGLKSSPLEYSTHSMSKSGKIITIKVKFQLSGGRKDEAALKVAAESFCKLMFHKDAGTMTGGLTTSGILGFSPVSNNFKVPWIEAMFRYCVENGPEFFKKTDPNKGRLSTWARVLSFAQLLAGEGFMQLASFFGFSGENIATFNSMIDRVGASEVVTRAKRLLWADVERAPPKTIAEQEEFLRKNRNEFERCLGNLCKKIGELEGNGELQDKDLSVLRSKEYRTSYHKDLCVIIYEILESAAALFTVSNSMLELFFKLRDASICSAAGNVMGVGISVFSGVNIYQRTAWRWLGIKGMVSTPGAGMAVGAAGLLWAAYHGISCLNKLRKMKEVKEIADSNKKIEYIKNMIVIIDASWMATHQINILLQLIQYTDAQDVTSVDFVDSEAKKWWKNYVTQVKVPKKVTGAKEVTEVKDEAEEEENPSQEDLGANAVLVYLSERGHELRKYLSEFDALGY